MLQDIVIVLAWCRSWSWSLFRRLFITFRRRSSFIAFLACLREVGIGLWVQFEQLLKLQSWIQRLFVFINWRLPLFECLLSIHAQPSVGLLRRWWWRRCHIIRLKGFFGFVKQPIAGLHSFLLLLLFDLLVRVLIGKQLANGVLDVVEDGPHGHIGIIEVPDQNFDIGLVLADGCLVAFEVYVSVHLSTNYNDLILQATVLINLIIAKFSILVALMEQIKKTALLKEKKRKEKQAKIAESLLLSKHSTEVSNAQRAISLTDSPNEIPQQNAQSTTASTETDSIIVKDLDTNQSETLHEAERESSTKFDKIQLPLSLREDFWNCYKSDLSHAEELFLEACAKGDLVQLDRILNVKNAYPVDINVISQQGRNCLHVSIGCQGTVESIRKLIFKGANINHPNKLGRTPLIVAAIKGQQDLVKILLENKCNINIQDNYGNTALHYSCMYNHQEVAQLLILHGADQTLQNFEQQTIFQLCSNPKIASLISKDLIEQQTQKGAQYGRTVYEEHVIKNSRADHVQKLLSLTERVRQSVPQVEQATSFKKKKTNFSRYQALSKIAVKETKHVQTSLLDFKHIDTLGKGAFGAVYLVENEHTKEKYALKVLSKAQVEAQKLLRYAMTERRILSTVSHPFIVKLHYAYQTPDKLIFIMDYCPGGDLLEVVRKNKRLSEDLIKKYAAEIVLALQELHKAEIIYRDLKPANVVIDREGHARLTDFGLAKEADLTHSFCGSLAYLSPQMLSRRGHTRTLDWYLLGVLIYECYTGKPPFYDTNKAQLIENIKIGRYKPFQASPQMKDIVSKLLKANIQKRLGNEGDADEVKAHPWFQDINWSDVYNKKVDMPKPSTSREILIEKAQRSNIFTAEEIQKGKTVNHIKGWEYES